ncbi:MAG: response regulator [Thermodesulfobacteriota bacterium]
MTDRRTDTGNAGARNGLRAVLVVRDPHGARRLNGFITSCGFTVRVEDDAVSALIRCKESRPELALVDHDLGGTSGIAFLRALLKVSWATTTILITPDDHEQVHAAAEGLGILGQITGYDDLDGVKDLLETFRELAARSHSSPVAR